MYCVCVCVMFQAKPKESHLNAVKRIFKYLSGTTPLDLFYPFTNDFDYVGIEIQNTEVMITPS